MSDQRNSGFPGSPGNSAMVPTVVSDTTTDAGKNTTNTGKKELGAMAGDAVTKFTEVAQEASIQAKETATSLAVEAGENVKRLMNKQVVNSADFLGHVAASVKTAAGSLDEHAPQLAKWAQGVATATEEFSASIRYQTVDELYAGASEYARRKPTLVFGAAAACGFLLLRLFKASPDTTQTQQAGNPSSMSSGSPNAGSRF